MGDIRGIREIHRVLQKQGLFAGSVPIVPEGQESVVFNKNRNYSIPLIKEMLETAGFRIEVEQVGLSPTDGILRDGAAAHTCTPTDYKELKLDEWATIPDSVYVWLARKI